MHSEGYSSWFVCLSVCSGTTGYKTTYERYQRLQNYVSLNNKKETTAFKRYALKTSEKANMHNRAWFTPT